MTWFLTIIGHTPKFDLDLLRVVQYVYLCRHLESALDYEVCKLLVVEMTSFQYDDIWALCIHFDSLECLVVGILNT